MRGSGCSSGLVERSVGGGLNARVIPVVVCSMTWSSVKVSLWGRWGGRDWNVKLPHLKIAAAACPLPCQRLQGGDEPTKWSRFVGWYFHCYKTGVLQRRGRWCSVSIVSQIGRHCQKANLWVTVQCLFHTHYCSRLPSGHVLPCRPAGEGGLE